MADYLMAGTEVSSTERALASSCQNLCWEKRVLWQALASICSVEHTSVLMQGIMDKYQMHRNLIKNGAF